jgi:chemotaxis protein methyltransferase CheR
MFMTHQTTQNIGYCPMSNRVFRRVSRFVQEQLGIKMPDAKRTMLQARLQKRLRKLKYNTFEEYIDYVFSTEGRAVELSNMIDAITTNKTDFFREPQHFDYLVQMVLPGMMRSFGTGIRRPANLWSAGCSTGEEPYTLAMVLSEFQRHHPQFRYTILGTDISTRVLATGMNAIYSHDRVAPVPMPMRRKYLMKSKDRKKGLIRINQRLRSNVIFRRINFMDDDFAIRETMDIVFCRNVLIYFDRQTQEGVLNRICRHLRPGGYLFTGHSETLNGLSVPLVQATSTVYRKRQ